MQKLYLMPRRGLEIWVFIQKQKDRHVDCEFDPFFMIFYKKIKALHTVNNMALRISSCLESVTETAQSTSTA